LTEHDPILARVVDTLKEPVRLDPDLNRRVMAEVEQLPPPTARDSHTPSLLSWLRQRRTFQMSPLSGLAAAAVLATLILVSWMVGPRGTTMPGDAAVRLSEKLSEQLTQFVLVAPEAASVAVVGDFNDWSFSATPLVRQAKDGVWWVTLPLPPGRYRYAFLVNGTNWRGDPSAPTADDEFGRPNSVVTIGG
jgi:hypothetical protein